MKLLNITIYLIVVITTIQQAASQESKKNSTPISCDISIKNTMDIIGRGCKHEKALCIELFINKQPIYQTVTSFEIHFDGTTNISDIDSIQIFSTGSKNEFYKGYSDTLLFGKAKIENNKLNIIGNIKLNEGSNYFWLTINTNENAIEGNKVDVAINSINLDDGKTIVPSISNPTDYQEIVISHEVLFISGKENTSCYRIPAIAKAPNGDLLAVIDQRVASCSDLYPNRNINIALRSSSNNGKTWSPVRTIVDFPDGESASDPSIVVDRITNTILLFYNYMNLDTAKRIYYFFLQKSTDNGITWSKPENITSQITKPEWKSDLKFITSSGGIQLKSGGIRHCMANLEHGLKMFGSDDHGRSWWVSDGQIAACDESKIVELADGSLMINSRVNNETTKSSRIVSISKDNGSTWISSTDSTLIDPRCNADIIKYSWDNNKNILLFSNLNSPRPERKNLTIRVSFDNGKNWTKGKVINIGSSAYSSLVDLQDGTIGILFEANEYKENRFARFSFDWLLNK